MRKKWSKEKVIAAIQQRLAEGKPVNYSAVVADDEPLTGAARRHFGTWDNALLAAGVNPTAHKRPRSEVLPPGTWTRDKIIAAIKDHVEAGHDIAAHRMQRFDPKLVAAATGKFGFGSWREAVEAAGAEVGQRMGRSHRAIGLLEAGVPENPRVSVALKLAHALECRVEDLFELREYTQQGQG